MENFDSIIDHHDKTCFSETDMQNFKIIKYNVQNNKGIKDFLFIKILGIGGQGTVWLAQEKKTGDEYAIKIIDCVNMNSNKMETLKAERNVLGIVKGGFVVKAVYSFTHLNYLCFVLDYMNGGDFD